MNGQNDNQKPNFYALFQAVGRIEQMAKDTKELVMHHDKKLATIEKRINFERGKAAGAGAVGGFIVSAIGIGIILFKKYL